MESGIFSRLSALGVQLPPAPAVVGNYVACRSENGLVFVSGQLPLGPGGPPIGKLGRDCELDEGREAARRCGLNLLAQLHAHCGLDAVAGCTQLTGIVSATPRFTKHPDVVDGASELMIDVFGEAGRHTRMAYGVASLPLGVPVEVAGIFPLRVP